jgi:endonuclease YncB( thermonuclease family)
VTTGLGLHRAKSLWQRQRSNTRVRLLGTKPEETVERRIGVSAQVRYRLRALLRSSAAAAILALAGCNAPPLHGDEAKRQAEPPPRPAFDRFLSVIADMLLSILPAGSGTPTAPPQRVERAVPPPLAMRSEVSSAAPVYIQMARPARILDAVTFLGEMDGRLTAVKLADLTSIPIHQICVTELGARDACGLRARLAITEFLSDRTLVCRTTGQGQASLTARCESFDSDISRWLVQRGYAIPTLPATPALAADLEEAKRRREGIWSDLSWRQGHAGTTGLQPR